MKHTARFFAPLVFLPAILAVPVIGCESGEAPVDGWLQWRGPFQSGVSTEMGLRDSIDVAEAQWTYDKSGRGTPVIADGRVYFMAYEGEGADLQELLVCLDEADGSVIWEHGFSDFLSDIIYNRYSITSPSVDPETGNVYCLTVPGLLCCFTADGELVWQHSMGEEFGRMTYPNGRTLGPLVDGDLIIFHTMTSTWGPLGPARDRFFGFDKLTGDHVWTSTTGGPPKDSPYSYPVFEWRDGKRLLYAGTAGGNMVCVNARNGDAIWRYQMSIGGVCASPVLYGDNLIAVHGKENLDSSNAGRLISLKLGAEKNDGEQRVLDKSAEQWRNDELVSFTSSPVLVGNRIYCTVFTGELYCVDADTGETLWKERLASDQIHASPVYGDGKLYVPMNDGSFYVLRPSDEGCEVLSKTELEGNCLGAPSIWNGRIYVHTTEKLYCFGYVGSEMGMTRAMPREPQPGPAVSLQIRPAEVLVSPGSSVEFHARQVDANGNTVSMEVGELTWSDNPMGVVFSSNGREADARNARPGAAVLTASADGLQGSVRFRVVYPNEFTEDFESIPLNSPGEGGVQVGRPPSFWISGFPKWDVREQDGSKVLAKTLDNAILARTMGFIGNPNLSNYTMQADVMTDGNRRLMSNVGLVNQRYLFILKGNERVLEIQSNEERIKHRVPFTIRPGTWYTMKTRVDVNDSGAATARVKVWPRGEAEPAEWTTEFTHTRGHTHGAPGIYGFALQSRFRVYMDNISVTSNN